MEKKVFKTYEEMSAYAAQMVCDLVSSKPNAVLGLPTGGTPVGMYENIRKMYKQGKMDFEKVTTFNLDEYLGLTHDHPQSYYYFMTREFIFRRESETGKYSISQAVRQAILKRNAKVMTLKLTPKAALI